MDFLRKVITRLSYRFLLFFFTLTFSIVLVVGSTYSWLVTEDNIENHFTAGYLSVRIQELFKDKKDWQPGLSVKKDIRVENTSNVPAIVRVSFDEHMLSFEIDTTDGVGKGNGNLLRQAGNPPVTIKEDDVATWKKGETFSYGQLKLKSKEVEKGPYLLKDPARANTKLLKYMNLKFGVLKDWPIPPADINKAFWVYEDGYFYYSQFVEPGKATEILLADLELSADSPNALKATLYDLGINLEAVSATEGALDTWGLSQTTSKVYELINPKIMNRTN
ncbi:BsaA family SipW-dependent biofilm matrix protein [Isobaculum melis]|uniref:Alternate signal-mediated exported protein, CPF_0494 family n=1 Tax=Isobaculum melis TaxID=142588 RepID=A0A1H9RLN3_9LACT|nr:BsaA family SipW-dependent biofilm matrix protein [Isobaculum melis]SER72849.1 alternate signal-mediated exported protein, CPF_0494 family [Isobaculum melis]